MPESDVTSGARIFPRVSHCSLREPPNESFDPWQSPLRSSQTNLRTADQKVSWADERARLRDRRAVPLLEGLLEDQDESVIAAAADALGHMSAGDRAVSRLAELLADTKRPIWLRDTCAFALGRLEHPEPWILEVLKEAAKESSNVGRCSRDALRRLVRRRRRDPGRAPGGSRP